MNLKILEACEHVTHTRMFPCVFVSAQWDAINEMDEYFSPIHTYQVCNVVSVWV